MVLNVDLVNFGMRLWEQFCCSSLSLLVSSPDEERKIDDMMCDMFVSLQAERSQNNYKA